MLLDKRNSVLENLDSIRSSYLKLVLLKQHELEAFVEGEYECLYELAEHERLLVDDITGLMKYIVPDLLYLRQDATVQARMFEIDQLQESVLSEALKIRHLLEEGIAGKRKIIDNIRLFPRNTSSLPHIISIRA